MATSPCVVLYGNSVFLAGIRAELEARASFELLTVEPHGPQTFELIRERRPTAILFDLGAGQPDFATVLLRLQPGMLLIGVDPSTDELLVLSAHPARALSLTDLVDIIDNRTGGMRSSNAPPDSR